MMRMQAFSQANVSRAEDIAEFEMAEDAMA